MDLLITLIGNAAIDPGFRELFLKDPLTIADEYGFRMTKGDFEVMRTMFIDINQEQRNRLEAAFEALEGLLYGDDSALMPPPKKGPCTKPCTLSLYPPRELPELRKLIDMQKVA